MNRQILFYYQIIQDKSCLVADSGEHVLSFEGRLDLKKITKLRDTARDEIKSSSRSPFAQKGTVQITGSIILEDNIV